MKWYAILTLTLLLALLSSCATPKGATALEKRDYVEQMRDEVLLDLYRIRPDLRSRIAGAAGYGVFTNRALKVLVLSTGHGFGLVKDNRTGKETYMRMARLGAGIGYGVKDFRAVFVFHDPVTLRTFVDQGWEFGGEAEAIAVMGGDQGLASEAHGSVTTAGTAGAGGSTRAGIDESGGGGVESVGQGIEVYQFTQNGLSLSATVSGTKYWKDGDLNRPDWP